MGLTSEPGKHPPRIKTWKGGYQNAVSMTVHAGMHSVRHALRVRVGVLGFLAIMPFAASFVISPVHQRDLAGVKS